MSLTSALALIQRRRPEAEPIPDFMDMLRQYEAQCRNDGAIVEEETSSTEHRSKKRTATAAVGPAPGSGPHKRAMVGPVYGPIVVAVGPQPHQSSRIGPVERQRQEKFCNEPVSTSPPNNVSARRQQELPSQRVASNDGREQSSKECVSTDDSIKK